MELRALISEALRAGAEIEEVLSSFWDDIVVELEVDAALLVCTYVLASIPRIQSHNGWCDWRMETESPTLDILGRTTTGIQLWTLP